MQNMHRNEYKEIFHKRTYWEWIHLLMFDVWPYVVWISVVVDVVVVVVVVVCSCRIIFSLSFFKENRTIYAKTVDNEKYFNNVVYSSL